MKKIYKILFSAVVILSISNIILNLFGVNLEAVCGWCSILLILSQD